MTNILLDFDEDNCIEDNCIEDNYENSFDWLNDRMNTPQDCYNASIENIDSVTHSSDAGIEIQQLALNEFCRRYKKTSNMEFTKENWEMVQHFAYYYQAYY